MIEFEPQPVALAAAPLLAFAPGQEGVVLDLDRLISSRMLVQANSGGGKSHALRQVLEQTFGRVQHLVLDPEGEFASLRTEFPYVLVGKEGDIAADPSSAATLCRRLVELEASAIIDLYELRLSERRRFVRLFLEELINLPRELWHPLLVVLDEAHLYCPERGTGEAESTSAVIDLCTLGRKRGFCAVLATQRISKLHKDAAAELLNVLIGRTGLDVDMRRAGDVLGFDKEQRQGLRDLGAGSFYAFGPALSREVVEVRTGQVRTAHPAPGVLAPPAPPPPEQLRKILAQLADLPAPSSEARDLEAARLQISMLEHQVRERDQQLVELRRQLEGSARAAAVTTTDTAPLGDQISRLEQQMVERFDRLELALRLGAALQPAQPAPEQPRRRAATAPVKKQQSASTPAAKQRATPAGPKVSRPQQNILNALAAFEAAGLRHIDRRHVAVWAGQSPRSSAFDGHLRTLRAAQLIGYPQAGEVALTEAGRVRAQVDKPLRSRDQLHTAWLSRLSKPQERILRVLIDQHPQALDREALAARAGQSPRSSAFGNHLSELREGGLLDYPQAGQVVATALLFPPLKAGR